LNANQKNLKQEFNPNDSIFDIRIKQYKNTLLLSIIFFVVFAGVFAGGMVLILSVLNNVLGLVLFLFSFILLFVSVSFFGVYIQSNKVIKAVQNFLKENDKSMIKEYANNANSESRSAYYQFLLGTSALVDIGTEADVLFFEELLEESVEKNKPVLKALMNLFAQKHGHKTFSDFLEK